MGRRFRGSTQWINNGKFVTSCLVMGFAVIAQRQDLLYWEPEWLEGSLDR